MELDILFLDIDGVLNPDKARGSREFAPECVAELKRFFAARPDTKVVFSTSWRLGFPFFVLGWLWNHHGLPLQTVAGRTPVVAEDQRGKEVSQWLQLKACQRSSGEFLFSPNVDTLFISSPSIQLSLGGLLSSRAHLCLTGQPHSKALPKGGQIPPKL